MHVYLDESGTFAGFHPVSISVVGALAIPDGKLNLIETKYAKIRTHLPLDKGEVKGRLLNERQVDEVVTLLARNEVLFEVTAIDLGLLSEDAVNAYKKAHAEGMLARLDRFREPDRTEVETNCRQIQVTPTPLYLQAIATFELLQQIIAHVPLYFVQRRPAELGSFSWVIDGKERSKVTKWETWWSWYAHGALATMSKRRPAPVLEGEDYSYFDRFHAKTEDNADGGIELKSLLKDRTFSSATEPGLELVDIVVSATRRALVGNLQMEGWKNIPRLMIHRKECYIKLLLVGGPQDRIVYPPYSDVCRRFSTGGKVMLTPANIRKAELEEID